MLETFLFSHITRRNKKKCAVWIFRNFVCQKPRKSKKEQKENAEVEIVKSLSVSFILVSILFDITEMRDKQTKRYVFLILDLISWDACEAICVQTMPFKAFFFFLFTMFWV